MSTFHPFPRLPQELRAYIWSLAAHPRLVHVDTKTSKGEVVCVTTPTLAPPVMQACHESRQYGPYRRAFTIGSEPRYVWVNFETDMICPKALGLFDLQTHKLEIQRLRITAGLGWSSYEAFSRFYANDLRDFPALKEIHVAIDSEYSVWQYAFEECYWGVCPRENIKFIDNTTGLMLSGHQLSAAGAWCAFHSWDGEGKIKDINDLEVDPEIAEDDSYQSLSDIRDVE
ncbi:hypothetical protein V8C35DRAFT_295939 [Trichoderma chlorosporum]